MELTAPPGERHQYSDADYMRLAAVIEDHLREAVLQPLGMTSA
ncbi:hypothetical protein ACXNSR_29050 [Streptomyces sp. NC-S4]